MWNSWKRAIEKIPKTERCGWTFVTRTCRIPYIVNAIKVAGKSRFQKTLDLVSWTNMGKRLLEIDFFTWPLSPTDGNLEAYDLYAHTIFSFRSIGQPSFDAGQRGRRCGPHGSSFGPKTARRSIGSMTYNRLFGLKPYNTKIKQISCSKFLKTVQYLIGHREFA